MGRAIQRLEDLHHGFPVDGVGERHRCFAFETVTGAPTITCLEKQQPAALCGRDG